MVASCSSLLTLAHHSVNYLIVTQHQLRAPHCEAHPVWGQQAATVTINVQLLKYHFLLADICFPILGINFLQHFRLVVEVFAEQLLARNSLQ
jgi:hypothetical protein